MSARAARGRGGASPGAVGCWRGGGPVGADGGVLAAGAADGEAEGLADGLGLGVGGPRRLAPHRCTTFIFSKIAKRGAHLGVGAVRGETALRVHELAEARRLGEPEHGAVLLELTVRATRTAERAHCMAGGGVRKREPLAARGLPSPRSPCSMQAKLLKFVDLHSPAFVAPLICVQHQGLSSFIHCSRCLETSLSNQLRSSECEALEFPVKPF